MAEPVPPNDDDAGRILERELYWAGDATTAESGSTRQLRIALHDFAAALRADSRSRVPRQEPLLGSASRWKRNVKVSFYLALRPVTHRYDRLLADLATLTRMLAERLADAEAEIAQLRERVADRAGVDETTGPSERATPRHRPRSPDGEG
jgi:hypothetical protein